MYKRQGQWPAATKTVSSTGDFPLTLRDGDIVELKGDLTVDFRAKTGQSPIAVAANAKAALIISGDVKLYGANASGTPARQRPSMCRPAPP